MEKLCVYCHAPATTDDHVPADCLFPKGAPYYATVPACENCNNKLKSKDDDYFRNILCYTIHDEFCDQYAELLERAKRAILRHGEEKSQTILRKMVKYEDFFEPDGSYQYSKPYLEPNQDRIDAYVMKIAVGLIWHEFGISSTRVIGVVKKLELLDHKKLETALLLNQVKSILIHVGEKVTSADVLRYQISQPMKKGDELLVTIRLLFYRSHCWLGVIGLGVENLHHKDGN